MVVAQRKDKKELFAKHLVSLNKSFHSWLKEQVAADPYADLSDGFQDYVDHVTSLEDRCVSLCSVAADTASGDCHIIHCKQNNFLYITLHALLYPTDSDQIRKKVREKLLYDW
ncbi:hypothetical protein EON64_02410 [archaeon]|nr:MAG: hypothetical protein EON64_02410 [archaeon]